MRVIRLHLLRFRGFADTVLHPSGHVVLVGEPRAGRTDLITGLRRVLDSRSTASRPHRYDVHRPIVSSEDDEVETLTTVEVTLVDLGSAVEQELDDRLEAINPATGLLVDGAGAEGTVLGLRLRYCLHYDDPSDTAEHWVEYPATGIRVPRAERELVSAVAIDRVPPLQLRAEGAFRRLVNGLDEPGLNATLSSFSKDMGTAIEKLASNTGIRKTLGDILTVGPESLLEMASPPEDCVDFMVDDGSVSAILRAVQPALALDAAGSLPLSSHGSTTSAVLSASEAMLSAEDVNAIVFTDDFGDDLDAASAEYLAAELRRTCDQVWISTRRPEVLRAFEPEEVVRLTRSHGARRHHQLAATTDRKARTARRYLHLLLLPAMTARTVALLEGPHDLEGYTAVADKMLGQGTPSPAAFGVRMIAPGLSDGGKDQLPKLAQLAIDLGFRVRVVLDHDKPGTDVELVGQLATMAEQVIWLPKRTSIERALTHGIPAPALRHALEQLNTEYGLGLDIGAVSDDSLEAKTIGALKQKGGLHRPFVTALGTRQPPRLARNVLDLLRCPPGDVVLVEMSDS
ncbi:hypothetical protein [Frankia sp. R43]|uniref:hypothetical protein n=1 Tax=Frankia sp. R43 TaxID=269536 RepID=UPI000B0E3E35|nr:hypothetical protein [Frankia sp. R43]